MTRRIFLSLSTGTIFFTLSTLPGFAQEALSSVRVSAAVCSEFPSPQAFANGYARAHADWHAEHGPSGATIDGWITAHNMFHTDWQDRRLTFTRQLVACSDYMASIRASERRRASLELYVLRPLRFGFLPSLPNTGIRSIVLTPQARADVSWRDERFAGNDRPTRRTRVQESLKMQESGQLFY